MIILGGYTCAKDKVELNAIHRNKIQEKGTDKKKTGLIMVL
ncbi:hypothetical protein [Parabacteroides goldsteinii]|nr:hypothetical protein [Parabacteroides goldsteinii]